MTRHVQCEECGGEMKIFRTYRWHDSFLGDMEVPAHLEEYYFCAECENEQIAYSLMKRIEEAEQKKTEQLLLQSVNNNMEEFKANLLQNKELVDLLGKSRQAIQQDGRIKTLIFHFIEPSGQISYWKKSVALFKEKGDGRFDLTKYETVTTEDSVVAKKVKLIATDKKLAKVTLNFPEKNIVESISVRPNATFCDDEPSISPRQFIFKEKYSLSLN